MPKKTLQCEFDHIWVEDIPEGEPEPTICPYHRGKAAPKAPSPKRKSKVTQVEAPKPVQTLYCEAGKHQWTRPPQRGKRPKNCPNHQPAPTKVSDGSSAPRKATATGRPRVLSVAEIRERYPRVDDESIHIFAYIEREINRASREEPFGALTKAYNSRLGLVARRHGTNPDLLPEESKD